jgi:hypothetical protein
LNSIQRLQHVLAPGWHALKLFWLPFCAIQALAVALVAFYYHSPALASTLSRVALWKDQGGLLFSMITVGLAGTVFPEIFKWITGIGGRWSRARAAAFFYSLLYFMLSGAVIDLFYRGQGMLFGTGTDFKTVVSKVLFDMWVFTPLWAHPFAITWFLFRRTRYHWGRTFSAWGWPLYRDQVFPVLLPGWAYWFPMTACIYSLPSDLQLPLFLFAISAWSLVFMFLASDRHEPSA